MSAYSAPDIRTGRLAAAELAANFNDVKPPLDHKRALVESNRCFYCYDAPCIEACPTSIDIPSFIRSISVGDAISWVTQHYRVLDLQLKEPNIEEIIKEIYGGPRVPPNEK